MIDSYSPSASEKPNLVPSLKLKIHTHLTTIRRLNYIPTTVRQRAYHTGWTIYYASTILDPFSAIIDVALPDPYGCGEHSNQYYAV